MTAALFHEDPQVVRRYRYFSRAVGVSMCGVGLLALVGWWWSAPGSVSVLLGSPPMTVTVAIGFSLSGAALLLNHAAVRWRSHVACLLSLLVLGLGVATLGKHALTVAPALDQGFSPPAAALSALPPGYVSGVAAAALVLLGSLGLLVTVRRWMLLREALAVALLAIAMTGLASHGIALAGKANAVFSQVPLRTSGLLLLATLGWLSATPTTGMTQVTTAATLGGVFARRLLLPVLLLPVAFTYVFQLLQSWLALPEVLTFALMATFSGGAVAWLIWWVALLLDKLERQRRESARLRSDADTDALTGLANRRAFDEALNKLLHGQREDDTLLSLVMLDLDRFKNYNDDFGHLAGDEVLRISGGLLDAAVRPADLAARYGGEEFALLLPATSLDEAGKVAQRVVEAFRAFAWEHRAVTISIGVAQFAPGDDAAALIRRADAALYQAKHTGRDRAVMAATPPSAASAVG